MADYKKLKQHQFPGDISKQQKAAMREGRNKDKRAKSFMEILYSRMRAVLKRRAQKEIDDGLDEIQEE